MNVTPPKVKVKYLTNKEFLLELQKSKASYSYFVSPEYAIYSEIVSSVDELNNDLLTAVILKKASKMSSKLNVIDPESIDPESIVFRVMTDEHLPLETDEKRRKKSSKGEWVTKPNFSPYKHYIIKDGVPVEVGRSHWKNGLHNGTFDIHHGKMTDRLARMFMLLVENISHKGNWRGYTYVDEMRNQALMHLSQVGLQFDESRSDNPFAFYTQIIKHCLGGETEILTREFGSVRIEDVAEQDVTLLDGNGNWVKCHIYDRGIQETQLNYFKGNNQNVGIWSTAEHGWVSNGERVNTKDFAGHNTKIDDLRPTKTITNDANYRKGIIHGLVYGDGNISYMDKNGNYRHNLTVCSHHESIMPYLEGFSYTPRSINSNFWEVKIGYSENKINYKEFPKEPGKDLDYLLGFLRGWFTADGCVSKNQTVTLCGGLEEYEWIKKWGPLVSWHLNSYTKLAEETNFGPRIKQSLNFHLRKSSMDADDFLIQQHKERFLERPASRKGNSKGKKHDWTQIESMRNEGMSLRDIAKYFAMKYNTLLSSWSLHRKAIREKDIQDRSWYVCSSQPNEKRFERVYCPIVPTTHTFILSDGIANFNCFTRILNLEKRHQSIRDDILIMNGAQPSYTRQVDNETDQRDDVSPKGAYTPSMSDIHVVGAGNNSDPEANLIKKEAKKRGRKPKAK